SGCHTMGKGPLSGPDLKGVFERRGQEWVYRWIHDPAKMLATDPIAKEMLREWAIPMPNLPLTDSELRALMAFISVNGGGELDLNSLPKLDVAADPDPP